MKEYKSGSSGISCQFKELEKLNVKTSFYSVLCYIQFEVNDNTVEYTICSINV